MPRIALADPIEDTKREEHSNMHPPIVDQDAGGQEEHHGCKVEPELCGQDYPKHQRTSVGHHWQIQPGEKGREREREDTDKVAT